MTSIKDVLLNLGYSLDDKGDSWRAKPLYRESGNNSSLKINKKNGSFIDFSANIKGSLEKLVQITLNLEFISDSTIWLKNKQFETISPEKTKPIIKMPKTFDIEDFFALPHNYYEEKGIFKETMDKFGIGVCHSKYMRNRYTFLIKDAAESIVGVAGRLVIEREDLAKWKLLGRKQSWCYPFYQNRLEYANCEEIILVESIGDFLALYECGFKNVIVLFGTEIFPLVISELIGINPKRIIVATNNDLDNNEVGNLAADKIIKKLSNLFDISKLYNGVPAGANDLFELFQKNGKSSILQWRESLILE